MNTAVSITPSEETQRQASWLTPTPPKTRGAFAIILEKVAADVAHRITEELRIPTIGIGAGPHVDGQLLVWTQWAGLAPAPTPAFVRQYADLISTLTNAATKYIDDVGGGAFPTQQHGF